MDFGLWTLDTSRAGIPACWSSLLRLIARNGVPTAEAPLLPLVTFPLLFNHTVFNRQECLPYYPYYIVNYSLVSSCSAKVAMEVTTISATIVSINS